MVAIDQWLFEPDENDIFAEIENMARIRQEMLTDEYERLGRYLESVAKLGSLIDVNA